MGNSITASIIFYFKGEKFTFSADVNLNLWGAEQQGNIEALYDIIATQNGLDRHRHEYDVMIMEPIQFSQAKGLAKQYVNNGEFDIDRFFAARQQQASTITLLQAIAQKHLDIQSLEEHPKLKAALLDAYHANKL